MLSPKTTSTLRGSCAAAAGLAGVSAGAVSGPDVAAGSWSRDEGLVLLEQAHTEASKRRAGKSLTGTSIIKVDGDSGSAKPHQDHRYRHAPRGDFARDQFGSAGGAVRGDHGRVRQRQEYAAGAAGGA